MINKVLVAATVALLIAALLLLVALLWVNADRDAISMQLEQSKNDTDVAIKAGELWRQQFENAADEAARRETELAARDARIRQITDQAVQWRRKFEQERRNDKDCGIWAAQPLPACILREHPAATGDGPGADPVPGTARAAT